MQELKKAISTASPRKKTQLVGPCPTTLVPSYATGSGVLANILIILKSVHSINGKYSFCALLILRVALIITSAIRH